MLNQYQLRLIILAGTTISISILSLMVGFSYFPISSVIHCLSGSQHIFAINDIRLPRLILGLLCGAMFALSGSMLQSVFRNPMASSETLGINAAASLFVLCGVSIFGPGTYHNLIYSFAGASGGFILTIAAARVNGRILHIRLIVTGIALGTLFKAVSQYMLILQDEKLAAYLAFLNGTLYNANWSDVVQITLPSMLVLGVSCILPRPLDIMLLSEDAAQSIGFNVNRFKIVIIFVAISLTAVAVSGVGSLGFIGLVAPNLSRLLFGHAHKYNLPGAALIGAGLTIVSDVIGRVVFMPFEIPSGIISIIIGVPYFLYIMYNQRHTI